MSDPVRLKLMKKAVYDQCIFCMGGVKGDAKSIRDAKLAVKSCPSISCPFYPVRFGKFPNGTGSKAGRIRKFCLACCNNERAEVKNCSMPECSCFPFRTG